MELKDLIGKHVLTGVDCYNEDIQSEYGSSTYHGQHISFVLDGLTYTAMEDDNDGYRSAMRDLKVSTHEMKNTFAPEEVVGKIRTKGEYNSTDDVLELISAKTGKIVLEIGTENVDDYYPGFVSNFRPENLSANAK